MMKSLLILSIALVLVYAVTAEEIPKCHGVSDEQMAEVRKLVVKEDIEDKILGMFSDVYGPKIMVDTDPGVCVNITHEKAEDGHLVFTASRGGDWFGNEKKVQGALQKVENGIYLRKKEPTGQAKAVTYFVFMKGNVYVRATCWMNKPPEDSHFAKLPFVTVVDAKERPMDEETTAHAQEAVEMLKQHPTIFGELAYMSKLC